MKTTVLIADDHELMREGIRALLERDPRFSIVASVADGTTASEQIAGRSPDVAILDAVMPGKGGIDVISEVGQSASPTRCVLVSMFEHIHLIAEAIEAGAGAPAKAAVNHQLMRVLGHIRVQVVHQHPHRRLGQPAFGGELVTAGGADFDVTVFCRLGHS